MWIVPGSPLPEGRGWKIWYSQPGQGDFQPAAPRVFLRGREEPVARSDWRLLPAVGGMDRRMGCHTVVLSNPNPGAEYEVRVPGAEPEGAMRLRSLPARIEEAGLAFLVASCFWHRNDREGRFAAAVRDLTQRHHPAFKMLIGDQIYSDWPMHDVHIRDPDWVVHFYSERYEENWGDAAFRQMLQTTPNFFLCDDHEFWNDYPEGQMQVRETRTQANRDALGKAAADLYRCFQRCVNPTDDLWYDFTLGGDPPVSFFVADTRSERDRTDAGAPHFFQARQWQALEAWAGGLKGPGVLLTGQPLLQDDGDWKDHSLSNFRPDYGRLWSLIEGVLTGERTGGTRHGILLISGDIHTGRLAVARNRTAGPEISVPELIASPSARLSGLTGPTGRTDPSRPPAKFTTKHANRTSNWEVPADASGNPRMPTLDDNLAMVRMCPGTLGKVRFELSIYSVRPYDSRSWWGRLRGEARPSDQLTELLHTEIELA